MGGTMYIELKCTSCGKSFRVDFTKNEFDINSCPKCGYQISFSDVSRIRAMTEPFYTNISKTSDVTVCGIHSEGAVTAEAAITAANLFFADMERLDKIYRSSSPEVQIQLANLIDKFYILVNSDAIAENSDNLALTLERMEALFWEHLNRRQAEMEQLLNPTQEE